MDPRFQRYMGTRQYREILWQDFRNGLAHGFTVRHGTFEYQRNYFSIKHIGGFDYLSLNPQLFFNDFKRGSGKLIRAIRSGGNSSQQYMQFKQAFDAVFVQGR